MRVFALLLALALAASAPLAGFNIGTAPFGSDVVQNGVVSQQWSQATPMSLGSEDQTLQFYVTSSQSAGFTANLNNPNPNAFVAAITPQIGTANAQPLMLTLDFTCAVDITAASNTITVSVTNFDNMVIYYTKNCDYPKLEMGPTRNVGTMIADGIVQPYQYVAPFSDDYTIFYLWLDPSDSVLNGQPFRLATSTYNTSALLIDYSFPLGLVARKQPIGAKNVTVAIIKAQIDCLQEYEPVTVNMAIDIGWQNNLRVSFIKNCTRIPRPGLNVGFYATNDVVSNGYTQGSWLNDEAPYDLGYTNVFSLALSLDAVAGAPMSQVYLFNYTVLTQDPAGQDYIYGINVVNGNNYLTTSNPQTVTFNFRCNLATNATVLMQFQIEPYDSIFLYFRKTCVFPSINVGSFDQTALAVSKSQSAGAWVSGAGDMPTTFYLWNDASAVSPNTPVPWRPSVITSLGSKLRVSSTPHGSTILPVTMAGPQTSLTVDYDCEDAVPDTAYPVRVSLDVGWDSKAVIFYYTKFCPGPSSGGMPPGGVAALVIFLLIFTACVGGCVYNRFKLDKSGLDVVPGADYYRRAFDWCSGKCGSSSTPYHDVEKEHKDVGDSKGVTPQRDFNDEYKGSSSYGSGGNYGSYQSDHL